jgi:hypothetical protein
MSNRDNTREKMSQDLRQSPEFSHFRGTALGICFALHRAWPGGRVAARALMLEFESRGSVVCRQARAG